MASGPYFIGLDLGQSQDFTAMAILERAELVGEWDAVMFAHRRTAVLRLRYLERIPLGTPYPEVVDRVRQVTRSGELKGRCSLMVDATGVGRPVVDLLRRADLGCAILAALITSGDVETSGGGYYRVPKRDLIVGLQVLLQRGGLRIAAGLKFGAALVEEMTTMRVKQTASGHEMVLAVALAHWGAKKVCPRGVSGDEGWGPRGGRVV